MWMYFWCTITAFKSSRNSCLEVFCRKGVYRNFTWKNLYQSLLFNKAAGLSLATLLIKRPQYRCFPVNFVKFLRTPFFAEHSSCSSLTETMQDSFYSSFLNILNLLLDFFWWEMVKLCAVQKLTIQEKFTSNTDCLLIQTFGYTATQEVFEITV